MALVHRWKLTTDLVSEVGAKTVLSKTGTVTLNATDGAVFTGAGILKADINITFPFTVLFWAKKSNSLGQYVSFDERPDISGACPLEFANLSDTVTLLYSGHSANSGGTYKDYFNYSFTKSASGYDMYAMSVSKDRNFSLFVNNGVKLTPTGAGISETFALVPIRRIIIGGHYICHWLNSTIKDFRIYNTALSLEEVQRTFTAGPMAVIADPMNPTGMPPTTPLTTSAPFVIVGV